MLQFSLPAGLGNQELEACLTGSFQVEFDAARPFRRTFLDTFDRRIADAGDGVGESGVVEWDVGADLRGASSAAEGGAVVRWIDPDGREWNAAASADQPVRFAEDLPPGPLRERLAPLLDLRALLPMVSVRGESRAVRVIDREHKTVVRLLLFDLQALDADARTRAPLGRTLELRTVRGYDREARRVERALRKSLGLEVARPLLERALEAIGRRGFGHSTRLDVPLDPQTPAQRALRDVLLRLAETIRANEPGVRSQLDTEFLHDLRVAVRRTRAALRLFRGLLPERDVKRFSEGFAWMGRVTSPARDLDVHLLEFDEHAARLDDEARQHLEPLRELLFAERERCHVELVDALDSAAWRRLLDDWEVWLRLEPHPHQLLAEGARPIGAVAVERTVVLHRKLLRRGRAIDDDSPAERLHDLRKLGKKLRYALELFRGLYDRGALRAAIRAMKVLQDNLGDFQDQEVQQDALSALGKKLLERDGAAVDTLLVMGRIVDDLVRRQGVTRRRFAECFASLDDKASRQLFDDLLATVGVREGSE